MNFGIAGHHSGVLDTDIPARKICNDSARLSNEQHAGRNVPGGKVLLPKAVEAPGRDISQVECSLSRTPDTADRPRHPAELPLIFVQSGALLERKAGSDQGETRIRDR